jgi:hypothetical protein
MAPTKKPAHRPLRGTEKLTERLSAMFSANERIALEEIAREKHWPMLSILIREAVEARYPEAFKESKK